MNGENKYADIISLPHHISEGRKRMSLYDRAAQFSPFAALTGHDEALQETARLTERKPELDESEKQIIAEKLNMIIYSMPPETRVLITHFVPDGKKEGGRYQTANGFVLKYDQINRKIIMSDKTEIFIDNIIGVTFRENDNM